MDPFIQYGMVAGIQAFRDSGFEVSDANAARIGCAIGSGIGGIGSIEDTALLVEQKGPKRISPFFVPGAIINMIAGNLSILYNLQGPNLAVVTACTTGTHNIGLGARLIAAGDVDAMLVGGAEMAPHPLESAGLPPRGRCLLGMTIRSGLLARGTRIETASSWAMAPECCCSNRWRLPHQEGLEFTAS